MFKGHTNNRLSKSLAPKKNHKRNRFNLTTISFKVVAGFSILSFFLNYTPSLSFPHVKKLTQVYAADAQTQAPSTNDLPDTFQVPFSGYLSTPFSSFHPGIDIAAGLGTPIHPIGKGTVVETGFNFWGLGLVVVVDHGQGYKSLYAHMGKIYVTKNQVVGKNDVLGEIGLTGNTTGPHTHLEISKNDVRIDPQSVLPTIRRLPQPSDFEATSSATPSTVLIPATASAGLAAEPLFASTSAILVSSPTPTPTSTPTPTPQPTLSPTPQPTLFPISLNFTTELTTVATISAIRTSIDQPTRPLVNLSQDPATIQTVRDFRFLEIENVFTPQKTARSGNLIATLIRPQ